MTTQRTAAKLTCDQAFFLFCLFVCFFGGGGEGGAKGKEKNASFSPRPQNKEGRRTAGSQVTANQSSPQTFFFFRQFDCAPDSERGARDNEERNYFLFFYPFPFTCGK